MHVFCAVRHSSDPRRYYGGLWSANFYPALRSLGHEVTESQTDLTPTSLFMNVPASFTREEIQVRAQTTEYILEELRFVHKKRPVDLFLSYFYNSHFDPSAFDEVRRLGIPSVNFYCNSVYQFDLVKAIAVKADFSWHAEKVAHSSYIAAGANPVCVQMAADPEVYRPFAGIPRKQSACFVGQRYADRDRWMAALVRGGVPVEIYGAGWGYNGGSNGAAEANHESQNDVVLGRRKTRAGSWESYLEAVRENVRRDGVTSGLLRSIRQAQYRRETRALAPLFSTISRGIQPGPIASVFSAHEVCLNFSNVWSDGKPGSHLIPHVRLRDFEGPMCRTCYLTGYTEEIAEFYDTGREIDTYRCAEELLDKTRFYLRSPRAAEDLREAGYRRATTDHTWARRFQELFRKIGLSS